MSNRSIYSIIAGSGKYIPLQQKKNSDFLNNIFLNKKGESNSKSNEEILNKFSEITHIEERRYAENEYVASDLGFFAAQDALNSSGIDKETLDYILVAHNFGDVKNENRKSEMVPSLATRIKHKLKIENPNTIAFDIVFGCPGWLQAFIQANYMIISGNVKRVMVIGCETLSRISDPHDIDSLIYADGSGAVILEGKESETPIGFLAHKSRTDTLEYANMLYMGKSYHPDLQDSDAIFMKMNGRKLYQYALEYVPKTIKECLDQNNIGIDKVKKVFIHQANGKMDDAILRELLLLYNINEIPKNIMPMNIAKLGNSSVATILHCMIWL
jgi:3-oxoacyl-[acyl-carrier-protein] synthase-3